MIGNTDAMCNTGYKADLFQIQCHDTSNNSLWFSGTSALRRWRADGSDGSVDRCCAMDGITEWRRLHWKGSRTCTWSCQTASCWDIGGWASDLAPVPLQLYGQMRCSVCQEWACTHCLQYQVSHDSRCTRPIALWRRWHVSNKQDKNFMTPDVTVSVSWEVHRVSEM